MPNKKVLVTDYAWEDLSIESNILGEIGAELVQPAGTSESDLIEAASGCDAIMTCWAQTTEKVIAAAENCKIVSRLGIGLDNIDVEYCTSKGIPVTNVPDYCVIEVAEHALASILSLSRKIAFYHQRTLAGEYQLQAGPTLRRISGQTLGIVGLGNIGLKLAELAQGIGLNVVATSRTPKSAPGIQMVEMDQLLAESDYISIHCPLTPETSNLFGISEFRKMKSTAYLINTARGGIINHDDMAAALSDDEFAGAALDVQSPEPPDLNKAPYDDPRVIVTPHAAFVSVESLINLRERSAQQVADRLSGKCPAHIVNGIDCT